MDRRLFLTALTVLPLAGGCEGGARSSSAVVPAKTFADLAAHPGQPLANRGLVVAALPLDPARGAVTTFAVTCAACETNRFDLRERLSMRPGGQTSPRGLNLVCHACQLRTVLFDATRDGYGGKLGRNAALSGERPVEQALQGADGKPLIDRQVRYACRYDLPPDDIFALAEGQGVAPAELFDGFSVEVGDGRGGWRQVWTYKAA